MESQEEPQIPPAGHAYKTYLVAALIIAIGGSAYYYIAQRPLPIDIPVSPAIELRGEVVSVDIDASHILVSNANVLYTVMVQPTTIIQNKVTEEETGETLLREINMDDISTGDTVTVKYLYVSNGVLSAVRSVILETTVLSLEEARASFLGADAYLGGVVASFSPETQDIAFILESSEDIGIPLEDERDREVTFMLSPEVMVYKTANFENPRIKRFWIEGASSDVKTGSQAYVVLSGALVTSIIIPIQ
jgi:hypothetical protein